MLLASFSQIKIDPNVYVFEKAIIAPKQNGIKRGNLIYAKSDT